MYRTCSIPTTVIIVNQGSETLNKDTSDIVQYIILEKSGL